MGCGASSAAHVEPAAEVPPRDSRASTGPRSMAPAAASFEADPFVRARGGELYLGQAKYRFASLCAPELLDGDANGPFEVQDTIQTLAAKDGFARAVTRTYTLRIKSKNISRGHINGWNNDWGDWEWDSARLAEMDGVLDEASKAGVKLIIPVLNQDYGDESTNWVGNHTDLVRMRKGISTYADAKSRVDWWTDEEMVNSFKLILDKLLNRVNSLNGRRYGDDPTILAWETGNEMNHLGMRPAPGSWTTAIARHIKHLAPNGLVMDGSFARSEHVEACYPPEVLACPDVDILSYHYYGSGDIDRVKKDCALARKHGKVFIAGEYGFFERKEDYARFLKLLDEAGGAGSLAWSLRPHSHKGGFNTHGEGNDIWSYHVPGFPKPYHQEFDLRERAVITAIRAASYAINKEAVPKLWPVPSAPGKPFEIEPGPVVAWTGSPWAERYDLSLSKTAGGPSFAASAVDDSVSPGEVGVELRAPGVFVKVRGVSVNGVRGEWSEEAHL